MSAFRLSLMCQLVTDVHSASDHFSGKSGNISEFDSCQGFY